MSEEIKSLDDVIKRMNLATDKDLAAIEERGTGKKAGDAGAQDMLRLLHEYRLCRSLLGMALDQRQRIFEWPGNLNTLQKKDEQRK